MKESEKGVPSPSPGVTCPACGAVARPGARFCLQCGGALASGDARGEAAKAAQPAQKSPGTRTRRAAAAEEERQQLVHLREILMNRLDGQELQTLCFDLRVDYDALPGEGKLGKARELLAYLARRGQLAALVAAGKRLRPDISWEGRPPTPSGKPRTARPPGSAAPPAAQARAGWGLWLLWALVTAVGGCVGGVVGGSFNGLLNNVAHGLIGWAIVGTTIGVCQWFLIQRYVQRSGWWILASAMGWAVGVPVGFGLCGPLGFLGYGVLIGTAQWLVLQGQVRWSGVWVLASIFGWGISGLLGWGITELVVGALGGFWGLLIGWVVGWTVGGGVAGTILGLPLVWLLRQPAAKA